MMTTFNSELVALRFGSACADMRLRLEENGPRCNRVNTPAFWRESFPRSRKFTFNGLLLILPATDHRHQTLTNANDRGMVCEDATDQPDFLAGLRHISSF